MQSFPFTVETHQCRHVLRDDLIAGGTKRRALNHLLHNAPHGRFFYAGTVLGHGSLALAHAAQDTGKIAELFLSCSDPDNDPMVAAIRKTNAIIHLHAPLPISLLYQVASDHAKDGMVLPPGFDCHEFVAAMQISLGYFDIGQFSEIWTTSVSGVLTRSLQACYPHARFRTVMVAKSNDGTGTAETFVSPEKYHRPALTPPPYSSCRYTDAKLWQFASIHAAPDALIWNTAG